MKIILFLFLLWLVFSGLIVAGAAALLRWVARGESDVNGDPERDAGDATEDILLTCETCGEQFNPADLDEVTYHMDHKEHPDIAYSGSRRVSPSSIPSA